MVEEMKEKKYKIVCRPLKYEQFISLNEFRKKAKRPKTVAQQIPEPQPKPAVGGILGMLQA